MPDFLWARLREPSTWRGVIAILAAIGIQISPGLADAVISLALLLMGGVAVSTPDQLPEKPPGDSGGGHNPFLDG